MMALAALASCDEAEEDEACQEVRTCFLRTDGDVAALAGLGSGDDEGKYKNFAASAGEWSAAYGPGGTCYDGDRNVCHERCVCVLRELCNDPEVREMLCDKGYQDKPDEAGECCNDAALRELEADLVDKQKTNGTKGDDGLDDVCEMSMDLAVPPYDELCPESE